MKCNENKVSDVTLLQLHLIVNIFLVHFRTITLDVCFVSVMYGHSDHDLTSSLKWERNFSLLLSGTAAFPSQSEGLNYFLELQTTNKLWIPVFHKTISIK